MSRYMLSRWALVLAMPLAGGAMVAATGGCRVDDTVAPVVPVEATNDDIGEATEIPLLPFSDVIDISNATGEEEGIPFCFASERTVWYRFTPATDVRVVADTAGSDYATALTVYTGPPENLTLLECRDGSTPDQPRLVLNAMAGQTYYFMVGSLAGEPAGGTLVFSLSEPQPPINDALDDALVIDALPFVTMVDTAGATEDPGDPDCRGSSASVWYRITPAEDMRITANTFGSDYDTTLSVYAGMPVNANQIACNDDARGLQSRVLFEATAGETYYFMVGAYRGRPGGSLVFSVSAVEPPPNDAIEDATVIEALPFMDVADIFGATAAPDEPGCPGSGATVWYRFSPAESQRILLDVSQSEFYPILGVFRGMPGSLEQITCMSDWPQRTVIAAEAGATYYVMLGSAGDETAGNLVFSATAVEPPPNDEIDDAVVIEELPFMAEVTLTGALAEPGEPGCPGTGATVWYRFSPAEEMRVLVDASLNDFWVTLGVLAGEPGNLAQIACVHMWPQQITFDAEPGQVYHVMLGSYDGRPGGTTVLEVARAE